MQLSRTTRVSVNLTCSLAGFFSGSTSRMAMLSVTLLFVEFRVLRRFSPSAA
jgi:hypothetical protein